MVVRIEVGELIRQDIGRRNNVEGVGTVLVLHRNHVVAEPVLPSQLVAAREVIYLLVLVQALVEVRLAACAGPENVPVMALGMAEIVGLEHRPHHLDLGLQDSVEQLLGL